MLIFLLFTLGAIIAAIIDNDFFVNSQHPRISFISKVLFILMLLACALRASDVGVDTENYIYSYILHDDASSKGRMEPFHYLLIEILKFFGCSEYFFLFVYALLTYVPLYFFLKRESVNFGFSLLCYLSFSVFFYFETFNIVRACAAVSWYLLSVSYLKNNNYVAACILAGVSVCFHYSAIVAIIITFFCALIKRLPTKLSISLVIISLVIGILSVNLFGTSFSLINNLITSYFEGEASENYSNMLMNFNDAQLNIKGRLVLLLPFSFYAIILSNKYNERNIIFNLFIIGVIISNLTVCFEYSYRITIFFITMLIALLPNSYNQSIGNRRLFIFLFSTFMIIKFIFGLFSDSGSAGVLPYHTFFS